MQPSAKTVAATSNGIFAKLTSRKTPVGSNNEFPWWIICVCQTQAKQFFNSHHKQSGAKFFAWLRPCPANCTGSLALCDKMLDYSVLLPKCVTLEKCWNVGCIAHVLFAGQKCYWRLFRVSSCTHCIEKFCPSSPTYTYFLVYSHFSISFLLCECVPHCGSTRFSRITLLPGPGVDWQESLEELPWSGHTGHTRQRNMKSTGEPADKMRFGRFLCTN